MKNWKRNLLASTLVFSLALPMAAQAEEAAKPATPRPGQVKQVLKEKWEHHQLEHRKDRVRHALTHGAHRQMYLTLLAEKYTPESVDEWEAAFAERKRLVAQWKERHDSEKAPAGEKQAHKEQMKQFVQELKQKVEKGEMTREQMKDQLKQWREKHFPEMNGEKDGLREALQQFKQIHEEFDAAIEAEDEAAIKAVLPKLLEEVKTINKHLAAKLEQKKN
jgi:hypothetical protein